jgi:hypothetical protein
MRAIVITKWVNGSEDLPFEYFMLKCDFYTLIFSFCLYVLVTIFINLPGLCNLTVGLMGLSPVRKKRKKNKTKSASCTSLFAVGGMNLIAY